MPSNGDFDRSYQRLLSAIDEAVLLLRSAGETQFADWLASDRPKIAAGKTRALQHLLSAYGGAGSINDILIADQAQKRKFGDLRTRISTHAKAMLRELDSRPSDSPGQ